MQFNFSLDQLEIKTPNFKSFSKFCAANSSYFIIAIVAIILFTTGYTFTALATGIMGSIANFIYRIWVEIPSLDFSTPIDQFTLTDVVNDLENKTNYMIH